jgi:hypothetical protein
MAIAQAFDSNSQEREREREKSWCDVDAPHRISLDIRAPIVFFGWVGSLDSFFFYPLALLLLLLCASDKNKTL